MQLFLTRTFQKNFERLPDEVRARVNPLTPRHESRGLFGVNPEPRLSSPPFKAGLGAGERVKEALLKIRKNPARGKRLQGQLKGEFSLRVGAYRIIYTLDAEGNVWIETVRARKDAYR